MEIVEVIYNKIDSLHKEMSKLKNQNINLKYKLDEKDLQIKDILKEKDELEAKIVLLEEEYNNIKKRLENIIKEARIKFE